MRTKSDHKLALRKSLFEWKYSNTPKDRSRIIYEFLYAKINGNNKNQKRKNSYRNKHSQKMPNKNELI